jgi:serine/threonine-protein kinase PknK
MITHCVEILQTRGGEMMATGDVELDAELVGGRYRPLRELGRGGMGRVLLCTAADDDFARDVPEDQGGSATRCEAGKVALKLLEEPGLRRAFVAEFELLRRLTAPCFPRALELQAERETGRLVDVMEWCAGPQVSAQALGSREAVVALAADLLRGLDQLHGLGYAHGDVSTANVLAPAGEGETARLVDLGAAGRLGDGRGATSGALAFAAPERLEGAPLSVGADLWSLGVLVFSLLHGRHPFSGYPGAAGAVGRPERAGLAASPLDGWLDRLLDVDAEQRFGSAAAALAGLEAASGGAFGLVPLAEMARRIGRAPFVDAGDGLALLAARLRSAADSGRAAVHTVSGAPGSGRTRFLAELCFRLAGHGIAHVMEHVLPNDAPGAVLTRALEALGGGRGVAAGAMAATRGILGVARELPRPVLLTIDDADAADAETAAALELLARTIARSPERAGRLLLVTSAQSRGEVELGGFGEREVEALLVALFPGRRVGARVAGPLADAAQGLAGRVLGRLGALAAQGTLTVTAAAVHVDAEAAAAVGEELSRGAADALVPLDSGLRDAAGLLAHARAPVPMHVFEPEAQALVTAGVAVRIGAGTGARVAMRAGSTREAAAAWVGQRAAYAEWARRFGWDGGAGDEAEAEGLWYALGAGLDGAREAAEGALGRLPARAAGLVVEGLWGAEGWPASAEVAARAAEALEAVGGCERAGVLWRRAAELAGGDGVARARALARVGGLEARGSRHAAALKAYGEAREALGEAAAPALDARIWAGMARSAVLTGALDDAERFGAAGRAAVREDPATRGALGYSAGLVHWYRGALDEADAAFGVALEQVRLAGDPAEEAAVITGLGLVAHRRGRLDEAAGHYRASLAVAERCGDEARVLTSLQNLGVVLHERGGFTEALDTYEEAMELAEALGQTGRVSQLAGNLGHLWRYLGELERAREVLSRGLELARTEGNRYMEGRLLLILGEAAGADEDFDQAERLLRAATEASEASQSAAEEAEARVEWGRILLARGDFAAARRMAALAAGRSREAANRGLEVQALALLAAANGRSVHGDAEAAQRGFGEVLAGLEAVTSPDGRWPLLLEASWDARRRGDAAEAGRLAQEVRRILRQLEDAVPARHREAFRRLRERRQAWIETTAVGGRSEGEGRSEHTGAAAGASDERWVRLSEVNRRLSAEHNVQRLLEYIMDSAILLSGAERGFLLLAGDPGSDVMDVRIARNLDQENIRNTRFKISHGIARRVIETGELALTIDAMEDERYRDQLSVHDLRLRSVLCLPMHMRGRVLGAIYLDNRFRASAFDPYDVRMLEAFADQAAIALDNARLVEAMTESQAALELARGEVEALNGKLAAQLAERTRELEDTHRVVVRQQRQLKARHQYDRLIGESDAIRSVFAIMDRLLDTTIPVLIEGESGTGKELVARAIHYSGTRAKRAFVAINCAAIPANLLESELFGHVRGAFTGATADKKGLFEAADGGTLLLDELGELPLEMQVKLLRVLQSGEIQKVGSTRESRVDVRIVAATNRQLDAEVAAGRFREDLYYRLAVIPIRLPPLRERREDIPLLVQHFIAENQREGLGRITGITRPAMDLLTRYAWPGNIRQLQMVLKNVSLFADGEVLDVADFQSFPDIIGSSSAAAPLELSGRSMADIERDAILAALRDHRGNKKRAAEQLGIDRRTLYNKLATYGIVVEKELSVR